MSNSNEEIKNLENRLKDLKKAERGGGNPYLIPGAVILAGVFVAGAIIFGGGNSATVANTGGVQPPPAQVPPSGSTNSVRPVTAEDHIRGSLAASVKIVEYSDYECPFCKRIHPTLLEIMDEYDESEVAWVYRHFPLDQLHPKNARIVASAAECVVEQKGNNGFWQFTDSFFEATPSNDRTDLTTVLPQIYSAMGVNQAEVEACIASGKYDQHIQDDIDNAIVTGGRGTPWSIVVGPNGDTFPLSGAQPINSIRQLVNLALKAE